MFDKLLIANRGEIALRVARTCERLGISTVAIHSEVDAEALHVTHCDEAICVGPAAVAQSYLNVGAIIEAAKKTGAQAVHPGYGALSESAAFATAVRDAGLVFVGASPEALTLFGDKLRTRELAEQAGVRVVPGGQETVSDVAAALQLGELLGFPLMVKAAAGGRGIGMLRVDSAPALERAVATCMGKAQDAFGDGRVFLEQFIDRPRHLEVQVVADGQGGAAALGERECSVQRRHRKLLDESPSPVLAAMAHGEERREVLCDAALRIAREAGYQGVGTAEFMMDDQGGFHFLEWSPCLQIEHGVTEVCTGVDLVEAQLRIAAGEALPPEIERSAPTGHAMEARIYAEDPARDFLPMPGKVELFHWPTVAPGALRVETGVGPGSAVPADDDPLVAKMITYARTRHHALLTLDRVLAETVIEPLKTNVDFMRQVLASEAFRAGQYDVGFVNQLLEEQQAAKAS